MRVTVILVTLSAAITGCAGSEHERSDTLTRREKDSIVAESGLPGAGGVRGAMPSRRMRTA